MKSIKDHILAQGPTPEQREAIFTDDFEFLLRASPGSGKTWTSCRRFIWRGSQQSYAFGGLALLSFTNVAIKEFILEVVKMEEPSLLSDPNFIGTFDSFLERFIIGPFGHLLTGQCKRPQLFTSERPGDRSNRNIQVQYVTKKDNKKIYIPAWEIHPFIENQKLRFRAPDITKSENLDFKQSKLAVTNFYNMGLYNHSQRGYWSHTLLRKYPHIVNRIARRFPEIIVDEAQDTSKWFLYILDLLRNNGSKITLVGDPDQCIYEYNMALPESFKAISNRWNLVEKPLSVSFRCNTRIASGAKHFADNDSFSGCDHMGHDIIEPILIRDVSTGYADSIKAFQEITSRLKISEQNRAILCRSHLLLRMIKGGNNCDRLKGKAKLLAHASFARDVKNDYFEAFSIVKKCLQQIKYPCDSKAFWEIINDFPDSEEAQKVKLTIWRFVKSKHGLPHVSLNGDDWINAIRNSIQQLIVNIGLSVPSNLNQIINLSGLAGEAKKRSLCHSQGTRDSVRYDTIHQAKGESLDAVLILGPNKFWKSVIEAVIHNQNIEERRIAYVGMTRARHLLAVGLPKDHHDNYFEQWIKLGFKTIDQCEQLSNLDISKVHEDVYV